MSFLLTIASEIRGYSKYESYTDVQDGENAFIDKNRAKSDVYSSNPLQEKLVSMKLFQVFKILYKDSERVDRTLN